MEKIKTALGQLEATMELNPATAEIGRYGGGGICLYSPSAVDLVSRADDWRGARRILRGARRIRSEADGPLRIRVSAWTERDHDAPSDSTDAFGWRAALAAARGLRREAGSVRIPGVPGRTRRVTVLVDDAWWADARDRYYEAGGAEAWERDYHPRASWLR